MFTDTFQGYIEFNELAKAEYHKHTKGKVERYLLKELKGM